MVGTTGTGTKFQLTGAVSGGAFSGPSVTTAGDYTVNPVDVTNEPLTNGTCVGVTGATATVVMGVLTLAAQNLPAGGSQWSASCSGTQSLKGINQNSSGVTATLACTQNTQVQIGSGLNTLIGSGSALATSATTGLPLFPTTAGAPTGTVGAAGQSAYIVRTDSHKICHSEGGGTWDLRGWYFMHVTMLQTADATSHYREILELTGAVNRTYCARHNISYQALTGVRVGAAPWMATYNRIFLMDNLNSCWVSWLDRVLFDADAFVVDMGFDLPSYIQRNERYCFIRHRGRDELASTPVSASSTWATATAGRWRIAGE